MIAGHPARATWMPQAASSWAPPETRALARHPEVRLIAIDQRARGADAKKAATPLAAHLVELAAEAWRSPNRGQCAHPGGRQVAGPRFNPQCGESMGTNCAAKRARFARGALAPADQAAAGQLSTDIEAHCCLIL